MLYFIAWVILMLAAVLAVPVAAMLENRKSASPAPEPSEDSLESGDDDELEPLEEGDGAILEEGALEADGQSPEEAFDTGAPDDFSAFEEEFK